MYIPAINSTSNREEIIAFMKRFSFAAIVTAKDTAPIATHLPFVVTEREGNVILTAHFAKANQHWEDIEKYTSLVIFSEPHAYISPSNYTTEMNVPTWNYIAVHAYGKGRVIHDAVEVMNVMESTINNYDALYEQQWNRLPGDYKVKMLKGIVAFEIVVADLQAKKKLSQNRTETEQQKIIYTLSKSNTTNEHLIADFMKGN